MKNKSNIGVILVLVLIILLALLGVYFIKSKPMPINEEKNNQVVTEEEIALLDNYLSSVKVGLSITTILSAVDVYNSGGAYSVKKDVNLLESEKAKQIFTMELIVRDVDNYNNFIILNSLGEEDDDATDPTDDAVQAYYPYQLFQTEYNKYFLGEFNLEKRELSNFNTKYDDNEDYIYYPNRRAGLNGMSIDSIIIKDVNVNSNIYTANVVLNYTKNLSNILGIESENASVSYKKVDNSIKIVSFSLK